FRSFVNPTDTPTVLWRNAPRPAPRKVPPMPPRLRPRLESLEGRMLLSTVNAPAAPVAEALEFVVPGTTAAFNIFGPAVFSGVVHALASQQASSVTLTLQRLRGQTTRSAIQVEVATGPI